MNLFDLKDRVVVMTGATGVLGKSISTYFALQGAKVAIIVRQSSEQKGELLAKEIKEQGGDATSFVADVMDKASLEAACEKVLEKYGKVDILMNAAGGNILRNCLYKHDIGIFIVSRVKRIAVKRKRQ